MATRRTRPQTSVTVRNLPAGVKQRLRARAAAHSRSLEAEARHILSAASEESALGGAYERERWDRIRARFARLGGVELEIPAREPGREPPRFDGR